MKGSIVGPLLALVALAAVPALAQTPAAAPAEEAAGGLSVEKTPISEIIKNDKAKAALESIIDPRIAQVYDQIGSMTLSQLAGMSQGQLGEDKLKALQAEFDKINSGK